jgi:TolB-like protein
MSIAESASPRLRIFGSFRVEDPGGLTVPVTGRRARALLAFLHLAPDGTATRDRLAGLLWSDRGDDQARASLRQTLRELHQALSSADISGLTASREAVTLKSTAFDSDLRDLRSAMRGHPDNRLGVLLESIGTQSMLEDLEIGGLFGDWLVQTRSEFEQRLAAAIISELERLGSVADWSNVRDLANAWLRRDPLDETVVAAAIRADGALGSVSGAQRRYESLKQALAREMSAAPSDAVEGALVASRASVSSLKAAPPAQVALDQKPLLAVLAFDNLSGDPELVWFSDGVSEEIQQTVARSDQLRVIGRTSSFEFRGENKSVPRVAAELHATHVLDGSVRRSGSRVRISAQLIACADQSTLWSDRFDRELTDVLMLQDEIAEAVAAALQATLARSPRSGKIDSVAYDLFLQTASTAGKDHVHIGEAIRLLERAVEMAPDFAAAWAALAHRRVTVYRRLSLDEMNFPVSRHEAMSAVKTALRLDPTLGITQTSLVHLQPWGDYDGRESLSKRAFALSPNDPRASAATKRRWDIALQAVALDPLNGWASSLHAQALAAVGWRCISRPSTEIGQALTD